MVKGPSPESVSARLVAPMAMASVPKVGLLWATWSSVAPWTALGTRDNANAIADFIMLLTFEGCDESFNEGQSNNRAEQQLGGLD